MGEDKPHWLAMIAAGILILYIVALVSTHAGMRLSVPLLSPTSGTLDAIIAVITVIGGSIGVWLLWQRTKHSDETVRLTRETFEKSQQAELATRFAKGVELLSSDVPTTRAGGVLILRDVATASPVTYGEVITTVLATFCSDRSTAYLEIYREEFRSYVESEDAGQHWPKLDRSSNDLVAAINIIGELRAAKALAGEELQPLLIDPLVLSVCTISTGNFSQIFSTNCYFTAVNIEECDFSEADISAKHFNDVHFWDCSLAASSLSVGQPDSDHGSMVIFDQCDLEGARLRLAPHEVDIDSSNVNALKIMDNARISFTQSWAVDAPPRLPKSEDAEEQYIHRLSDAIGWRPPTKRRFLIPVFNSSSLFKLDRGRIGKTIPAFDQSRREDG